MHAGINGAELTARAQADPEADLFVHPECGCATSALYLAGAGAVPPEQVHILSTGGMLDAAKNTTKASVLVATEVGMLHQLRRANPAVDFRAVNERASCGYMKTITPGAPHAGAARGSRRGPCGRARPPGRRARRCRR